MTAIDTTPADWLRALLRQQPDVRSADFDIPPHPSRILLTTASGQRLLVSIGTEDDQWEWDDDA